MRGDCGLRIYDCGLLKRSGDPAWSAGRLAICNWRFAICNLRGGLLTFLDVRSLSSFHFLHASLFLCERFQEPYNIPSTSPLIRQSRRTVTSADSNGGQSQDRRGNQHLQILGSKVFYRKSTSKNILMSFRNDPEIRYTTSPRQTLASISIPALFDPEGVRY